MFSNDEEEDFGAGGGSSKLASLFDLNRSQDGNQSLMYNAPKQPKKSKQLTTESPQHPSTMSVIHAVAVHAYKFENGNHVSQGKLGAAILGNNEAKTYKILLYKGQQQHITISMITLNFSFIIQSNNYGSFYDNQTVNWSIHFESESAICNFAKQICIAKANSCGKLESLIFQDLVIGEGEVLETEDSVDIKYTVNLLTDGKIGELVESNLLSDKCLHVKIHQGKQIKGLEDSLVGMKRNGKRLAIIPPSAGYGNKKIENSLLKSCNLLYEIYVVKVKLHKQTGSRSAASSITEIDKDVTGRYQHSYSSNDDVSVRARGASLSEQLSQVICESPDRKKATIISRIVKMGQPMIPLQGAVVAQQSDSDNEDEMTSATNSPLPSPVASDGDASNNSEQGKPVPKPRPQHHHHHSAPPPLQQILPQIMQSQPMPQPLTLFQPQASYPVPYQQITPTQYGVFGQSSFTVPPQVLVNTENQMLLENRGQMLEMRVSISKLGDKLDTVLTRLEQSSVLSIPSSASVDTTTLSYSIQKLISENDKLRADVNEKNNKIDSQNEKISDLLNKNLKFIEQSNEYLEHQSTLQMNSTQTQAAINILETEKERYLNDLKEVQSKLGFAEINFKESEEKAKNLQHENEVLKKEVETQNVLIDNLQITIKALQTQREELENNLDSANAARDAKEGELEKYKDQYGEGLNAERWETVKLKYDESMDRLNDEISKAKQVQTKVPEAANIVSEVKRVMNGVYRKLQGEFDPDFEYAGRDVCKVIKDTVLTVTLRLVEKFEQGSASCSSDSSKTTYINEEPDDIVTDNFLDKNLQTIPDKATIDVYPECENKSTQSWKPEPPPPPYFAVEDDDDEDDWLK